MSSSPTLARVAGDAQRSTPVAWLRTSLSLTSIGVAVTQLFRLTSALYSEPASSQASALPPNLGSGGSDAAPLTADQLQELVLLLYAQVQDQAKLIDELGTGVDNGRTAYRHLGKPIGVAFIALGLSFLFIGQSASSSSLAARLMSEPGHYRYFRVQHVLQTNKYPPSRSAIVFGTLSVGIIIIASFASILVVRPPGSA